MRIESRHTSAEPDGIDPTRASNLVQHQVRDLPDQDLFEHDVQGALRGASMRVRYECTRLASHSRYPLERMDSCELRALKIINACGVISRSMLVITNVTRQRSLVPLMGGCQRRVRRDQPEGEASFPSQKRRLSVSTTSRAVAGGAIMSFSTGLWRRQVPLPLGSRNHGFKTTSAFERPALQYSIKL